MIQLSMAALVALVVAGCAGPQPRQGEDQTQRASLRSSNQLPADRTHYDGTTGQCSAGSLQLVSQQEYESLISGWRTSAECEGVSKSRVPDGAGYPTLFAKLRKSGSAEVLVRLQGDGSVESAHAICASDQAFADAAVATANAIRFRPAMCEGQPVRSSFLLPFSYHF